MATKIKEIQFHDIPSSDLPLVIGYFGSIHVMHCQLFDKYHRFNVLTFKDFRTKTGTQLYSYQERLDNIQKYQPKNIFVFDIVKKNMKAEDFIQKVLLPLGPSAIVVGTDFKFGSDHKSYEILKKYFTVDTVTHNKTISTSKISKMLSEGKVEIANNYLDRPYYYVGKWVKGDQRGRKIGVRTINILIDHRMPLIEGSYITKTTIGSKTYMSVTFVGKSKTFKVEQPVLETTIIGKKILPRSLFTKSVRDSIKVEFFKYIRKNTKFTKSSLLLKAIEKDIEKAKTYLARNK